MAILFAGTPRLCLPGKSITVTTIVPSVSQTDNATLLSELSWVQKSIVKYFVLVISSIALYFYFFLQF